MTTDVEERLYLDDDRPDDEELEDSAYDVYKSMSKLAIGSLVMAVLALTGLVFPVLLGFAAIGTLLGIFAWRNLRRYPDELTGRASATIGLVGSLLILVGGSIMHSYIYATEVPDGYLRISFAELQPKQTVNGVPEISTELDGQRVFVKGYVHPGVSNTGRIKKFVLVPDMGTCCFGGQPKMTDMIEVTIRNAPGVQYSQRKRKLGGVLHVSIDHVKPVAGGITGGLYELDADYVK